MNFLKPATPNEFIGMQSHIRAFREILPKLWQHQVETQFLLLIGESGTGKSSLLNAWKKLCQEEGVLVHHLVPRLGTAARSLPKDLQSLIIPHAKEAKKSIFRLSLRAKSVSEITPRSDPTRVAKQFIKALTRYEFAPEVRIIIFIDQLERLVNAEFIEPLALLAQVGRELKNARLPIVLVGAMEEEAYHITEASLNQPFLMLQRLNNDEAEQFLITKGPSLMKNESLRRFCIQSSDRTPFSLMWAVDLVHWAIKELKKEKKVKEVANVALIISKIDHFLKRWEMEEFITRVLSLSPPEHHILMMLLESPKNLVKLEKIRRLIPDYSQHLNRLIEHGIIHVEEEIGLACLTSEALHVKTRTRRMGGSSTHTASNEIDILLQIVESEILAGLRPPLTIIERMEKNMESNSLSPKEARIIAEKMQKIFEAAFLHNFHDVACRFGIMTGKGLELAGQDDNAGNFLNDASEKFISAHKEYMALVLLKEALMAFQKANDAEKRDEIADKIANLHIKQARELMRQKPPLTQLARAQYYQALQMISALNDEEWFQRIMKEVESTFSKNDDLKNERLQFFTTLAKKPEPNPP